MSTNNKRGNVVRTRDITTNKFTATKGVREGSVYQKLNPSHDKLEKVT